MTNEKLGRVLENLTFVSDCHRCGTKSQTFDIIWGRKLPRRVSKANPDAWMNEAGSFLLGMCRNCGCSNEFNVDKNENLNLDFAELKGDITFYFDLKTQYPTEEEPVPKDVPEHIAIIYREALASTSPEGACNAYRRVVEAVLRDKNKLNVSTSKDRNNNNKRKNLGQTLAGLGKAYALPKELRMQANGLKAYKNWGEQWYIDTPDQSDAKAAGIFCDALLHYVYELPGMLKQSHSRYTPPKRKADREFEDEEDKKNKPGWFSRVFLGKKAEKADSDPFWD